MGATAKLLLEFGADMDDNTNVEENTPLHLATQKHNQACATVLIENGCDVNRRVSTCYTSNHVK